MLQQHTVSNDLTRMLGKVLEDVIFRRGEVDFLATAADHAPFKVNAQVSHLHDRSSRLPGGMAKGDTDSGQELLCSKWFGDVIVGSLVEG